MYNEPTLPVTGAATMAVGGFTFTVLNIVWLAIALVVVGGAIVTLSKFGPRFAFEPKPYGVNGRRWAVSKNGRVVRWVGRGK